MAGGDYTNDGGVIEALAGSEVELLNGAAITGGSLSTTGDGIIRSADGSNTEFNSLTLNGNFESGDNTDTQISGTITNSGSITIASDGGQSDLEIAFDGATLTGGGTVTLTGANAGINDVLGTQTLTIADQTIQGVGNIGRNTTDFNNQAGGTVQANVSGETLVIDPASTFNNAGTLRASGGGTLQLAGGNYTNTGTFEALDGGTLNAVSGANLTNLVGGVLTGGTYRVVDDGSGASISLLGTPLTELETGTELILSGANSAITFGGVTPEETLTANRGTIRVLDNRDYELTASVATFDNNGVIELGGGTLSGIGLVSALANNAGGEFFGFGTLDGPISNGGLVRANGGTLTISSVLDQGGGSVQVDANSSLDVSDPTNGNSSAAVLSHNGDDLNLGSNDFLVTSDYDNANFGVGNAFNARANVSGSGQIVAEPGVDQTLTGANVTNGTQPSAVIDFGNVRVGDSSTESYAVNNVGDGPVLRGAIQTDDTAGNGGGITDTRLSGSGVTAQNFGALDAGTASSDLEVTFDATSAGSLTGQQVAIVNNFDNVDNQLLTLSGNAFNAAVADVTPTTIDFGIVHVGDTLTAAQILVANQAAAGAFSEDLRADNLTISGDALLASGSPSQLLLDAGDSDDTIGVLFGTATAGSRSGSLSIDLTSTGEVDGNAIAGLGELSLGTEVIEILGQVNNFAEAELGQVVGDGVFSTTGANTFLLDFGLLTQGDAAASAELGVTNSAIGPADELAGSFGLLTSPFSLSGFSDFDGLLAGDTLGGFQVGLDTSTLGIFSTQITFDPLSQNASGFSGALSQITINVTGEVQASAIPEPSGVLGLAFLAGGLGMRRNRRPSKNS